MKIMRPFVKQFIVCLLWLMCGAQAWADGVTFRAIAPSEVETGTHFQLQYTVNSANVSNLRVPNMGPFNVLYGPSTSTSSSYQIVNGKASSGSSVTYTYTMSATRAGTFTIPSATLDVDGKTVKSNAIRIRVLQGSSHGGASGGGANAARPQGVPNVSAQTAGNRISGKDLFMAVTASKRKVYEQEAVLLTYKVYALVNLRDVENKMPDIQGAHLVEVPLPQMKNMSLENHNGLNYRVVVWKQYLLFPQQTGQLVIPSVKFNTLVVQRVNDPDLDPFDAFFNGGSNMQEVEKTLVAPSLTLQVDALPQRPANFSGGVGNFNISSSINTQKLKTGDALNLRVVLSGVGNMKLVKTPTVPFPKDFEVYDPKTTDKTEVSAAGVSGNKIFDYLAIPRNAGKYTIPPVEFTFFDPQTGQYKTVKTEPYEIEVEKGSGNGRQAISGSTNKEDLLLLNQDIHYIKQGKTTLRHEGDSFFASMPYVLAYLVPFALFVVVMVVFRKKAKDNANEAKMRGKKANKVAVKRLRNAEELMRQGNQELFYDDVLKALWGYIGDKLNIPVAELSKDNVQEKLSAKAVDASLTQNFINVLNDCEFARFAPGDKAEAMSRVYQSASDVINKMENSIKQ